jgi:hypothetical protein
MIIKQLFKNDIERSMPGVIKIGQDEYIKQELEEYVVTRELRKHFSNFFKAYEDSLQGKTDDIGVWISGFFGSGKSHFLKILSYLMENKEVDNKKAIDYFQGKIEDDITYSSMKLTSTVPTDVIIFNIDAKAEVTSVKSDSILNVFVKVFNEMRGYCGTTPWVAELEEKLDKEDKFEEFKEKFEDISGIEWEEGRNDIFFEEDALIEALVTVRDMSEESAKTLVEKAEQNYSMSIDKFAIKVNEYLEKKDDPRHHVVFLVDEVGQFVGEDGKMMLKIQTIAEELGSKCKGRAWLIVTSQQDIDGLKDIKGYDFSKIQGRFATRLSLSGSNADEVIKERVLSKNDHSKEYLENLFVEKGTVINNLINFSSDTPEAKNYSSKEEFAELYPFIPYQFKLLQSVFSSIRKHGASGRHLAEAERSLLSAYQESAIKYRDSKVFVKALEENVDEEHGILVPFYSFYDTIESFLDHNIRIVFANAENNTQLNDFDIDVLKILFMIKYVKDMPKNLTNITALMIENINQDKLSLKDKIQKSLLRLKDQMFIEQNGEEYIFLTDEEQDVNREIQHLSVSPNDIIKKANEILFTQIYKDDKYRYKRDYDFNYNKKIDDYSFNKEEEISIQFLTPLYAEVSDQELMMKSERNTAVIVKVSPEFRFIDEIETSLKINKFIRNTTANQSEERKRIIDLKTSEIKEREDRARSRLERAIVEGEFFVNGKKLNQNISDPEKLIDNAFEELISMVYSKLDYIDSPITDKKQLQKLIETPIDMLTEETENNGYNDVKRYINIESGRHEKTPISKIMSKYTSIPYGWNEYNVAAILIQLLKYKRIRIQYNTEDIKINNPGLLDYLTIKRYRDKIVIKKREEIDGNLKTRVNQLIKDVFNENPAIDDEDRLEYVLTGYIDAEISKMERYIEKYEDKKYYPGQETLEDYVDLLRKIRGKNGQQELFQTFVNEKKDLLDYAEDKENVLYFLDNQSRLVDKSVEYIDKYYNEREQFKTHSIDTKDLEDEILSIQKILDMEYPYEHIHELNDLNAQFEINYANLLEDYARPVKEKTDKVFYGIIKQGRELESNKLKIVNFKDKEYENIKTEDLKEILEQINLNKIVEDKNSEIQTKIDDFVEKSKKNLEDYRHKINYAKIINDIDAIKVQSENSIENYYNDLENIKTLITKSYNEIDELIKAEIKKRGGVVKDPPEKLKFDKNIKFQDIVNQDTVIKTEEDIDKLVDDIKNRLKKELKEAKSIKFRWGN